MYLHLAVTVRAFLSDKGKGTASEPTFVGLFYTLSSSSRIRELETYAYVVSAKCTVEKQTTPYLGLE